MFMKIRHSYNRMQNEEGYRLSFGRIRGSHGLSFEGIQHLVRRPQCRYPEAVFMKECFQSLEGIWQMVHSTPGDPFEGWNNIIHQTLLNPSLPNLQLADSGYIFIDHGYLGS